MLDLIVMGWVEEVAQVVRSLPREFTLGEVYQHGSRLAAKFPGNDHVEAKIRQSLQVLRDDGMIEFLGRGKYRRRGG